MILHSQHFAFLPRTRYTNIHFPRSCHLSCCCDFMQILWSVTLETTTQSSHLQCLASELVMSIFQILLLRERIKLVQASKRFAAFVVEYKLFEYNIYQQLDSQLLTLANAAAHSLSAVKAEHSAIHSKVSPIFDNDGDLDIPWKDLRKSEQSVEWFNAEHQLIGKVGKQLPEGELVLKLQAFQQGKIRTFIIPVYQSISSANRQQIQGYVRVGESIQAVETELGRLRWGLGLGGIVALLLTSVGGLWLTQQSLKPIEQSFQQLNQLNEQLKQFTADASHELRNPLTVVKTSIQVMLTHPERIHPADVEKLDALVSATNQMTRLVEDLLMLARTNTKDGIPAHEWIFVHLDELLEDLVDYFSPQAQVKGVSLKTDFAVEVLVEGDAARLRRLFSNLLENALHYTPSGGTVTYSAWNGLSLSALRILALALRQNISHWFLIAFGGQIRRECTERKVLGWD